MKNLEKEVKVGDIIVSKWSSSGALWEVTDIGSEEQIFGRQNWGIELKVKSVKTGRSAVKYTRDMKFAPEPKEPAIPRAALEARIAELEAENAALRRGRA